jgi:hypothetical protein
MSRHTYRPARLASIGSPDVRRIRWPHVFDQYDEANDAADELKIASPTAAA